MAYDEAIAERIRKVMKNTRGVEEKKMFGGIAFMLRGHMCVGVNNDLLMVRLGPEQYEKALTLKGARPMDFTGKPLRGFVYVSKEGFKTAAALKAWIKRSTSFIDTLPAKKSKSKKVRRKKSR